MNAIAIITGDIVASTASQPSEREQLYAGVKTFLEDLRQHQWLLSFEHYRGDSFQCLVQQQEKVLRVCLFIRCYMLSQGQDIRVSAGIGSADFLHQDSLATSDGEAFHFSGEGLDALKDQDYRMMVTTPRPDFNTSLQPAIWLLDALMQKWTPNQAATVLHKLQDKKEEEIAQMLNVTQPAINQRSRAAQWFAVEKLVSYFENTVGAW